MANCWPHATHPGRGMAAVRSPPFPRAMCPRMRFHAPNETRNDVDCPESGIEARSRHWSCGAKLLGACWCRGCSGGAARAGRAAGEGPQARQTSTLSSVHLVGVYVYYSGCLNSHAASWHHPSDTFNTAFGASETTYTYLGSARGARSKGPAQWGQRPSPMGQALGAHTSGVGPDGPILWATPSVWNGNGCPELRNENVCVCVCAGTV